MKPIYIFFSKERKREKKKLMIKNNIYNDHGVWKLFLKYILKLSSLFAKILRH